MDFLVNSFRLYYQNSKTVEVPKYIRWPRLEPSRTYQYVWFQANVLNLCLALKAPGIILTPLLLILVEHVLLLLLVYSQLWVDFCLLVVWSALLGSLLNPIQTEIFFVLSAIRGGVSITSKVLTIRALKFLRIMHSSFPKSKQNLTDTVIWSHYDLLESAILH